MPRTRLVTDCSRFAQGGAEHTWEEPFTEEEEVAADAHQADARTARDARHAAEARREADIALLRERGAAHDDPLVAAACRILAGV